MNVEKCFLPGGNAYYVKYLLDIPGTNLMCGSLPAIIICPGGGYLFTSDHEAEPVALNFLNHGYQAFVLRYTTKDKGDPSFPNPLLDLAKLISLVRKNAEEWNINPDEIAVLGFSAGGHLCASLGTMWNLDFLSENLGMEKEIFKPNAEVLCYPLLDYAFQVKMIEADKSSRIPNGQNESRYDFIKKANRVLLGDNISDKKLEMASPISHVSKYTPPTFIWHTASDNFVYVGNSLRFALKLEENNIPFELHIFEKGPHGLSLANERTGTRKEEINNDVAIWPDLADRFLHSHFMKSSSRYC